MEKDSYFFNMLRCPVSGERLHKNGDQLVSEKGEHKYKITKSGIPLFAEKCRSEEARIQEKHFAKIASKYFNNLNYQHTREYMKYLDHEFILNAGDAVFENTAEICCGRGEALQLFKNKIEYIWFIKIQIF